MTLHPVALVSWLPPSRPVFSPELGLYFANSAFHSSGINYTIKLVSGTTSLAIKSMSINFRSAIGDEAHFPTRENPIRVCLYTQSSFRSFQRTSLVR